MTPARSAGDESRDHGVAHAGGTTDAHAEHAAVNEHSIWPFIVGIGTLLVSIGVLAWMPIAVVGAVVIVASIIGWLWQPWETM